MDQHIRDIQRQYLDFLDDDVRMIIFLEISSFVASVLPLHYPLSRDSESYSSLLFLEGSNEDAK